MTPRDRAVSKPRRRRARGWHRLANGLKAEALEPRLLPAALTFPAGIIPLSEAEPNDTVDVAQDLGDLSVMPAAGASGRVGDGPAAAADVDWYHFDLDRPAR